MRVGNKTALPYCFFCNCGDLRILVQPATKGNPCWHKYNKNFSRKCFNCRVPQHSFAKKQQFTAGPGQFALVQASGEGTPPSIRLTARDRVSPYARWRGDHARYRLTIFPLRKDDAADASALNEWCNLLKSCWFSMGPGGLCTCGPANPYWRRARLPERNAASTRDIAVGQRARHQIPEPESLTRPPA